MSDPIYSQFVQVIYILSKKKSQEWSKILEKWWEECTKELIAQFLKVLPNLEKVTTNRIGWPGEFINWKLKNNL